jgi:hypothetical protein
VSEEGVSAEGREVQVREEILDLLHELSWLTDDRHEVLDFVERTYRQMRSEVHAGDLTRLKEEP